MENRLNCVSLKTEMYKYSSGNGTQKSLFRGELQKQVDLKKLKRSSNYFLKVA